MKPSGAVEGDFEGDFGSRAISAALWSAFGHWLTRLVAPLVFLALARVLTPEDFGIAALATMVTAFCQVIADAGMGKVIIQRQREGEDMRNVATNAFWTHLTVSCVLLVAIAAAAPLLATLFAEPRASGVIRVQAVQLLFGAFSAIPLALLQRDLNFRAIFWVQFVTSTAAGALSVPLAIYGWGYWALVAGSLAGALGAAIWFWNICGWRPQARLYRDSLPSMLRFGAFSMGEGISGWMFLWLDVILVGLYLSTREVGLYRTAGAFVAVLAGLLVAPFVPVIFRAFSMMQHDPARLRVTYLTATQLMTLVSVMTSVVLLAAFDYWPALVFGAQWQGIELPLFIFLLLYANGGLSYANAELFRAANRPEVPLIMNGVVLAAYFVGFTWSLSAGFEVFLLARYGLAVLSVLAHVLALDLVMGIRPAEFLGRTAPSLAVFAAFVAGLALLPGGPAQTIALAVACGLLLLYLNRRECGDLLSAVRRAARDGEPAR